MDSGGVFLFELFTRSSTSFFAINMCCQLSHGNQGLSRTSSYTSSRLALGVAWPNLAKGKPTGGTMLLSLFPLFSGVLTKLEEEASRPFDSLGLWIDILPDFRGDFLDRATLLQGD